MKKINNIILVCTITVYPAFAWGGICQALTGMPTGTVCNGTTASNVQIGDPTCRSTSYGVTCRLRDCHNHCLCDSDTSHDCCASTAEEMGELYTISYYGTNKVAVYKRPDNTGSYDCNSQLIGYKCQGGYFGEPAPSASELECESCMVLEGDFPITSYGPKEGASSIDEIWTWNNIMTESEYDCYIPWGTYSDNSGTFNLQGDCYYPGDDLI